MRPKVLWKNKLDWSELCYLLRLPTDLHAPTKYPFSDTYVPVGYHTLQIWDLFLQQIEIELSELDGPHALFINKFWGREHIVKKFANSNDGKCTACGNLPRQENEDFNILKLEVLNTDNHLSLSAMINNSFSQGAQVLRWSVVNVVPIWGTALYQAAARRKMILIKTYCSAHQTFFSFNYLDLMTWTIQRPILLLCLKIF